MASSVPRTLADAAGGIMRGTATAMGLMGSSETYSNPETGFFMPPQGPNLTPTQVVRETQDVGRALQEKAAADYPISLEQRDRLPVKLVEGATELLPILATGPFAPAAIGLQSLGDHISRDWDEAKKAGKSDEDAAAQALNTGLISGASQAAVFAVMPKPLRQAAEKYILEKFGQGALARIVKGRIVSAGENAALMGTSHAVENVVTGRPPLEGVPEAAGGGALLGAILPPYLPKRAGQPETGGTEPGTPARPATPPPVTPAGHGELIGRTFEHVPGQMAAIVAANDHGIAVALPDGTEHFRSYEDLNSNPQEVLERTQPAQPKETSAIGLQPAKGQRGTEHPPALQGQSEQATEPPKVPPADNRDSGISPAPGPAEVGSAPEAKPVEPAKSPATLPAKPSPSATLERALEIEKAFGLSAEEAAVFNHALEIARSNLGKYSTAAEALQKEALRIAIKSKVSLNKTGDLKLAREIAQKYGLNKEPGTPTPEPLPSQKPATTTGIRKKPPIAPTPPEGAPVTFAGFQERMPGSKRPPLELWQLTEDWNGLTKGSHVSRGDLEQAIKTAQEKASGETTYRAGEVQWAESNLPFGQSATVSKVEDSSRVMSALGYAIPSVKRRLDILAGKEPFPTKAEFLKGVEDNYVFDALELQQKILRELSTLGLDTRNAKLPEYVLGHGREYYEAMAALEARLRNEGISLGATLVESGQLAKPFTKQDFSGTTEGQVRRLDVANPESVTTDEYHEKVKATPIETAPAGEPGELPKLNWKPFKTRAGQDKFLAEATPEFWNWWNASGKKDNPPGLRVSKYQDKWQVWSDKPVEEQTTPIVSVPVDILDRLEAAKIKPGDKVLSTLIPGLDENTARAVWNTGIDIAKGAIKAGRAIAQAVEEALAHIRSEYARLKGAGPLDEAGLRARIEGDASEATAHESPAFKANAELADELGIIKPSEGEEGVPTKVGDVYDQVLSRPGLDNAVKADSVSNATSALREAGLTFEPAGDGLFKLADEFTQQEAAGQKLVPILEREIQLARSENRKERIANLLNSVAVHLARDKNQAFTQALKNKLFALAQGERSGFGRALGSLAMWGKVLANVAMNPDLHLGRLYSRFMGGAEITPVMEKLMATFRSFFTPEEIRTALDPLNLENTANRLIQLNQRESGGRVYRQVQARLKAKIPKTQEQKNRKALEDEAVEAMIRHAAELGQVEPKKLPNQKLTKDEQLALVSQPKVAAKIQQATEQAVKDAEYNAGWRAEENAARGNAEALSEVADRKAAGEEPSPEMVEAGLQLKEYAHWQALRDDLLQYSPTTLKLVREVISGRFKGTKFKAAEEKLEDLRIDLNKLAVSPDAEVQRVFDAQVSAVKDLMRGATPETVERVSRMFRDNIEQQLADRRQEIRDKVFEEKKPAGATPDDLARLREKINAGLLDDPRLKDPALFERAAQKSTIHNLLPNVSDLVQRILEAPRYKLADIKTDLADALNKQLGLAHEQAASLAELIYKALDGTDTAPGPLKRATANALKKVQAELAPQEKPVFAKGKTLWQKIERGVRAGLFDPGTVLEDLARQQGWTIPTPAEKAQLKAWVEQEIALRRPAQRQIDAQKGDVAKATRQAEIGTESERLALIKKIQSNWSRWSLPVSFRHWLSGNPDIARNNAKAVNEFVAANLLLKAGFAVRQAMDVGLVSMPLNAANRTLVHVLERAQNEGGFSDKTIEDLDAATREMITARLGSFNPTLRQMERTATGHSGRSELARMTHSIGIFERMLAKADALESAGNKAGARALRVMTILRAGYRVAETWDAIQSVGLEWQEMRQQLSTDLRAAGKNRAEIATQLDDIFGGIKVDMLAAIAEAQAIGAERGLAKDKNTLEQDAWNLVKAKAYDRMRQATGTDTNYEAENQQYRELHSWNLPETGGVGGVIAETLKSIKGKTEKAGVPTGGLFSFGNAMGIAANRMLTFSGGGLFGGFGFGDSPWYKGERNIKQRRIEAAQGLAAIGIMAALAAAGKVVIQTQYPKNKEEKEKFIAEGHKINTIRWVNDDGSWQEFPIQMAPFGFIAAPLYMIGGVQQLLTDQKRAQAKLDAEAAKTGTVAGKAKAIEPGDVMGVLAQGAYGLLTGGRTASGAVQSFSDYGNFNLNKTVAGLMTPYLPGLPAWQEAARILGSAMDTRTATLSELLFPSPWNGHQRVNSLGDPMVNPNAVTRALQVLTGGIGFGSPQDLLDNHAYQQLFASGFATPDDGRSKGYNFGGTIRPMTPDERERYLVARGQAFNQQLQSVDVLGMPETQAHGIVAAAYRTANAQALREIGAEPSERAAGGGTAGLEGIQTASGIGAGSSGVAGARVASGGLGRAPSLAGGALSVSPGRTGGGIGSASSPGIGGRGASVRGVKSRGGRGSRGLSGSRRIGLGRRTVSLRRGGSLSGPRSRRSRSLRA
jgi:hypothetical protein